LTFAHARAGRPFLGFSSLFATFSCTFSAATSAILGGIELTGKGGEGGADERGGAVATFVPFLLASPVGIGGGGDWVDVRVSVVIVRRCKRVCSGVRGIEGARPTKERDRRLLMLAAAMYWALIELAISINNYL